jgi:acylphosphatase
MNADADAAQIPSTLPASSTQSSHAYRFLRRRRHRHCCRRHRQAYGGYFRAHARNEAFFHRKLTGALQEYPDRTEIIVEGKRSAIDSFVRWCRRGPGLGQQIRDVDVSFNDYVGIFDRWALEHAKRLQARC